MKTAAKLFLFNLLALFATGELLAQSGSVERISAAQLASGCAANAPRVAWVLDSSSTSTCDPTSTGSSLALCCCRASVWESCTGEIPDLSGYFALGGRAGGQVGYGGVEDTESLTLRANDEATTYGELVLGTEMFSLYSDSAVSHGMSSESHGGESHIDIRFGSTGSLEVFASDIEFYVEGSFAGVNGPWAIGDANSAANSACLSRAGSDRLYHDTDCDGTQAGGEQFIDVVAPADGDKGDITVSGSGATWTVDSGAVGMGEVADDVGCTPGDTVIRNSGDSAFDCAAKKATLFLAAEDIEIASGTPTLSIIGGHTRMWQMPDAASSELCGTVGVPQELRGVTFDYYVLIAPNSTSTCNYRLAFEYKEMADGDSISSAGTSNTPTSVASSGTASVIDYVDSTANVSTDANSLAVSLCLTRVGSHANDSCSNVLYLIGLILEEQ